MRKRQELPPLEIVPDVTASSKQEKVLPFNEYKRWLCNLRHNTVKLTPVKPLNQVRCQTATLRSRTMRKLSAKPSSPKGRIFTVSSGRSKRVDAKEREDFRASVFFTTGHEESCGIFDLKALNDALTKPRNKVVPMPQSRKKIPAAVQ